MDAVSPLVSEESVVAAFASVPEVSLPLEFELVSSPGLVLVTSVEDDSSAVVLELLDSEAVEPLIAVVKSELVEPLVVVDPDSVGSVVVECASPESDTVAEVAPDDVSLVPSVAEALELWTGVSLQARAAAKGTYTNQRVDTLAS